MSALTVPLTVKSVNGKNVSSSFIEVFPIDRMYGIRPNQNLLSSMSFVDSNAAANTVDHSSWLFSFRGERPSALYWSASFVGTDATVSVFSNSSRTNIVASGSCVIGGLADVDCFLSEVNNSGISGYVKVDKDLATSPVGTISISGQVASKDLQLAGQTEFVVVQANGSVIKYTVEESVSAIQVLIGAGELLEAEVVLTPAQVLALNASPIDVISAPAAGSYIDVVSAQAIVDFATTAYDTQTTLSLVFTAGTESMTCATILAATADKIGKFTEVAGEIKSATSLKVQTKTGEALNGDSPVTIKVLYRLVSI